MTVIPEVSAFRLALMAFGFGEWAFVHGELTRVAVEQPLVLE